MLLGVILLMSEYSANFDRNFVRYLTNDTNNIRLCPTRAQTCVLLLLFCNLDINRMTLKLEDEPDILKMDLHTENEAASLRHSKLNLELELGTKYENMSEGQNVKSCKVVT